MDIIKYTVKTNNKEIIIKTFINGKLHKAVKMPEAMKQIFLNDCNKVNMTFEEGIIFIQNKLNNVEKLRIREKKDLELMSSHYHR